MKAGDEIEMRDGRKYKVLETAYLISDGTAVHFFTEDRFAQFFAERGFVKQWEDARNGVAAAPVQEPAQPKGRAAYTKRKRAA